MTSDTEHASVRRWPRPRNPISSPIIPLLNARQYRRGDGADAPLLRTIRQTSRVKGSHPPAALQMHGSAMSVCGLLAAVRIGTSIHRRGCSRAAAAAQLARVNRWIDGANPWQLQDAQDHEVDDDRPPMVPPPCANDVNRQKDIGREACPWRLPPAEIADVCSAAPIQQQRAPIGRLIGEPWQAQSKADAGQHTPKPEEGGQHVDDWRFHPHDQRSPCCTVRCQPLSSGQCCDYTEFPGKLSIREKPLTRTLRHRTLVHPRVFTKCLVEIGG